MNGTVFWKRSLLVTPPLGMRMLISTALWGSCTIFSVSNQGTVDAWVACMVCCHELALQACCEVTAVLHGCLRVLRLEVLLLLH